MANKLTILVSQLILFFILIEKKFLILFAKKHSFGKQYSKHYSVRFLSFYL